MAEAGETVARLPTGSLPIDETKWSADHGAIKDCIGVFGNEDVFIDREGHVWLENPDGTFANYGEAATYTGSGSAKGRRGKDRSRRRR